MDNEKKRAEDFIQRSVNQPSGGVENRGGRRSFVELLLDPRTLQGLMLLGGGLLVLGLVVWLWSIGVFENRLVVAGCLGATNLGLLIAGIAGVRFTPYQTASRAVTLLACVVMPLNLWFYDAQGLITLDQGGRLWVPALVCCAIYVAVARLLADPLFVHAIVGGITMTGMLFLADQHVEHFWEITAPSSFLVVLGMICIHAERAFPEGKNAFSRAGFGREFFRAGHVVLGIGLMVLFVGRLCGRLYDPLLAELGWFDAPAVTNQANLKLLALAMTLGGAYSYIYSQVVVRAQGRYLAPAAIALLWSGVILLDVLAIPFTLELLILLVSLGALAVNATAQWNQRRVNQHRALAQTSSGTSDWTASLVDTAKSLGLGLNVATVCLGLVFYGRVRFDLLNHWMPSEFGFPFLVAMIVSGVSCWLGLRVARESNSPKAAQWHLEGLAVAGLLAMVATIALLGMPFSIVTLAMEMILPIALAGTSLVAQSEERQRAFSQVAYLAAAIVMIVGVCVVLGLIGAGSVGQPHLWMAVLFAESALCFGMVSIRATRQTPSVLTALSVCAAAWQLLVHLGVTQHGFILAASVVGLLAMIVVEFLSKLQKGESKIAAASLWTGRICVTGAGVGAVLLSMARLLTGETVWIVFGLLLALATVSVVAALLPKQLSWRRFFVVLATGEALMALLVVNSLSDLSMLQRGELLLTVVGLVTLAAGYFGWYREDGRRDELVSFNLAAGSALSAVPMTIGLLAQRFGNGTDDWGWILLHEAGALSIGMVLLGAGVLCRIRWSTVVGASTVFFYLISLIGLVELPDQLQTTAVYMMVGGGLFFAGAVLLGIYRDRLLAMPKRIEEGEGVFRVLKWR